MRQFVLKQGDAGQMVSRVQRALGIAPADGKYGPGTAAKVAQFQAARPPMTADGITGAETFRALGIPQPCIVIDVSKWQGKILWDQVKQSGVSAVYVRASQGVGYTDPLEAVDVAGANAVHLPTGLYHFCTMEHPAYAEANHFCDVMDATPGETLRPMMDVEVDGGLSATALVDWIDKFVQTVKGRGYTAPLFYTNLTVLAKVRSAGWHPLPDCRLWIARYSGQVDDPDVDPTPFGEWALWQWTASGDVQGIDGHVDLDWFCGTLAELQVAQP